MGPKKKVDKPVEEPVEEVPVGDPLSGTDFFRYVQSPHVTYEGGYDTYTPPPDPALAPVVEVETKKDKKGKKDDKAAKVPKGSKAVDEEPPVSTEPARLVKQGFGTYNDENVYYRGDWEVDMPNGQGSLKYPSGATYEGQLDNGRYQGNGKYTWPDGSWYDGGWMFNKFHGMGKFFDQSKDKTFEGQYYNGAGPGFYGQS
eukprot:CAMPEP_0114297716 /NCGR_PEP_ID=MMETSP0059-20121206/12007_1 /TAXON_ID=36894 /ORGANISM="Pyramimonas parkeae, Strain CCMP726" /LENGTH=199 /DNA_ID=CAMNT_0001419977 /DNA_START=75 /DNA_END=674 /DNA_ORIENTATION=+